MPDEPGFAHLHVHTDYSMLDGAARVSALFAAAEAHGMPALAMTDHGFLFGAFDFWKTGSATSVKPIIGLEAYVTPGTHRLDRTRIKVGDGGRDDISQGGAYTHMTLWAENNDGYRNLSRIASYASLEGTFYKPRADRELLHRYRDGLIGTTGCPSGEIQTRLRFGDYDAARAVAAEYRDILGAGNYYLELMDHGLDIERRVQGDLLRLAKDLDLPLLATNDAHYVAPEDTQGHAALLCVQSDSTLAEPKFAFDGDGYYLKSAAEMRHLFRELPEACDNTLAIAERCTVTFTEDEGRHMPHFPVPEGHTEDSWFTREVYEGLDRRFPGGVPDAARAQADYEIGVITGKGYAGYFLIVADFVTWAKDHGIRVGPGRGSGAGSICAYAMRITDLDPIEHGLIFERFLNPERPSMPDFDIDFDERRREEVIRYVSNRYGPDHVAQIVTYGTIKAKQAVKDAARVLGMPYGLGDRITRVMPAPIVGRDAPLAAITDPEHPRYGDGAEVRALAETDPEVGQVLTLAAKLEGLRRQWGVHAAGVIMSNTPLVNVIPIMKREADGAVLTQFDYPTCEKLGLVKMDFLGLRNLTVLDDALANIRRSGQDAPVLEELPLDDPDTFRLFQAGNTLGVFQLDSPNIRALLRSMVPTSFEDISATLALYRPGPMGANAHIAYADRKNGREPIVPIHPELAEPLAEILDPTYGVIVFQEQVQLIAQKVAGYTLGSADLLRRAMGKKKPEVLAKEYDNFAAGMHQHGYSPAAVKALWDILVPFADYAFNRAHTAAYGLIAYWTAYLKAHHPGHYLAALLTSAADDRDTLAVYLREAKRIGLSVLPPSVNDSIGQFAADESTVRFGLSAVKDVGSATVAATIATRGDGGPFLSLDDYARRMPPGTLNAKSLTALIAAGAFDFTGHPRAGLSGAAAQVLASAARDRSADAAGQDSLFDEPPPEATISPVEWPAMEKLRRERDTLGLYVSAHPLDGLNDQITAQATVTVADLASSRMESGTKIKLAGLITGVAMRRTKKGDLMASFILEDYTGAALCTVFPRAYQDLPEGAIQPDLICQVRGELRATDAGDLQVVADTVRPIPLKDPALSRVAS